MTKKCNNCCYFDICSRGTICDDYVPLSIEGEDIIIEELIESNRKDFHTEWTKYITGHNN